MQLTFVQTVEASSRDGLSIPPDGAFQLRRLREIGESVTSNALRELGDAAMQPVLQARIGQESSWTMQGRAPAPILRGISEESSLGPDMDFGVRLGVTVERRADGRLRVFVRPTITGVDYERSVEQDGVIFPTITTSGTTLYKDIQPGETLVLTGLLDDESRRRLRRTPTDSKNAMLVRTTADREKQGAGQLLVLITPQQP